MKLIRFKAALLLALFATVIGFRTSSAENAPESNSTPPSDELMIDGIDIRNRIFNPSKSQTVTINYRISRPTRASVKIFGPDMRLVADLHVADTGNAGKQQVVWNGKDDRGRTVPDEAYFITVEAYDFDGGFAFYDPTVVSGREYFNPQITYDIRTGRLTYSLNKDSRLRVRAGIHAGPLLKTLMNWKAVLSGENSESWDGTIAEGRVMAANLKGFRLFSEGLTLPDNSIITVGNTAYSYPLYRKEMAPDSLLKMKRPLFNNEKVILGQPYHSLIANGINPKFQLELPAGSADPASDLPIVGGTVPILIRLDDAIERYVIEQRYEIICFVDYVFVTEKEEGYSPATWQWDSRSVSNGAHVLTVNVASYPGHVTAVSRQVFVKNE